MKKEDKILTTIIIIAIIVMTVSFIKNSKLRFFFIDTDKLISEKKIQAEEQVEHGKFEEAIQIYDDILYIDSNHQETLFNRGLSYQKLYNFKDALHDFEQALKDESMKNELLYQKALTLYALQEYDKSLKTLNLISKESINSAQINELKTILKNISNPTIPTKTTYITKAENDFFYIKNEQDEWEKIFIKGVNIGTSLPGYYPSDYPRNKKMYAEWMEGISQMNANAIRVYTILPPEFYEAFYEYNQNPNNPRLWLIQGIWALLPEDHNFKNQIFEKDFQIQLQNMTDVIHGRASIPPERGRAYGLYIHDVSPYVLAQILGREWESFAIETFNNQHPSDTTYNGDYLNINKGNAIEVWLTKQLDYAIKYETEKYHHQIPTAFANWPPLDSIYHPSESTFIEEHKFLEKTDNVKKPNFDLFENDIVEVDATKIQIKDNFKAGLFASFHIYPYYPDFMINDPQYQTSGTSSMYFKYLEELKSHHANMPLLVAEYGAPTSRGSAHIHPQGWNNGYLTEKEQGELIIKMTDDLIKANTAGGIVFEWIDEWSKKNWLTADLIIPFDNNILWYSTIDPEQNFGLVAVRPGAEESKITMSGEKDNWIKATKYAQNKNNEAWYNFKDGYDDMRHLKDMYITSDEGYLYLRIDIENLDPDQNGIIDFNQVNYMIGIDTFGDVAGNHLLPHETQALLDRGIEFMIFLQDDKHAYLKVNSSYNTRKNIELYGYTFQEYNFPFDSIGSYDAQFSNIEVETNRVRIGREGQVYPRKTFNFSELSNGSLNKKDSDYNSLTDYHFDLENNMIEIRIPWFLLNVTDPSQGLILHSSSANKFDTERTDGFYFYALSYKPLDGKNIATPHTITPNITDALPIIDKNGTISQPKDLKPYSWDKWYEPSYHFELKDSYFILKNYFETI